MNWRKIFLSRQSFLFMASQVSAGVLNYLFQIHAARSQSTLEFGSWSQWLAQFSVACFAGLWLQSLSAISPLENRIPWRPIKISFVVLLAAWVLASFLSVPSVIFFLSWLAAIINGFLFGIALRQGRMFLLAISAVTGALSKFIWTFLQPQAQGFYGAVTFAPWVMAALLLFSLRTPASSSAVDSSSALPWNSQLLWASLSLAFFSAWVPQVDLLVSPHFLSENDFGLLARVALATKGFFFGFQILAQLLLSHQARAEAPRLQGWHFAILGAIGLAMSLLGALLSPSFGWPPLWTALSLLHTGCLCLLSLTIQDMATRHLGRWALGLSLLSVGLATIGAMSSWKLESYWAFSIAVEVLAVAFVALHTPEKSGPHEKI